MKRVSPRTIGSCVLSFLLLLSGGLPAIGPVATDEGMAWAAKRKSVPRKNPELKIIEVSIKPIPYAPQQGDLEFEITLDLPPEVEPTALLEVTALISSPSRSSLRFLSYRNPIAPLLASTPRKSGVQLVMADSTTGKGPAPRIRITLTWDGKDHTKQEVSAGTYHYELRAKVIAGGDNTPRTLTVSWPKRGTLAVK